MNMAYTQGKLVRRMALFYPLQIVLILGAVEDSGIFTSAFP